MINHPLQNTASKILGGFKQTRPRITQKFGERPEVYKQFGHKGHNGVDFGPNGNETIYAPFTGVATVLDQGSAGYGLHIKITDDEKECVLGHLSEVLIKNGTKVYMGDKVGKMGSTGFSTAKHLHFGLKYLANGKVVSPNNGYKGSVDPLPFLITWKGTHLKDDL